MNSICKVLLETWKCFSRHLSRKSQDFEKSIIPKSLWCIWVLQWWVKAISWPRTWIWIKRKKNWRWKKTCWYWSRRKRFSVKKTWLRCWNEKCWRREIRSEENCWKSCKRCRKSCNYEKRWWKALQITWLRSWYRKLSNSCCCYPQRSFSWWRSLHGMGTFRWWRLVIMWWWHCYRREVHWYWSLGRWWRHGHCLHLFLPQAWSF